MAGELENVVSVFTYDFRQKFANAMAKDLVGVSREIKDFGTRLQGTFGNQDDAVAEFAPIAADMHASLLRAYDTLVEGRKAVQSYQNKSGTRLPGALRTTLQSPTMAVASGTGIQYLDLSLLNSDARHWRRLNFGTQGSAVHNVSGALQPVSFDGRALFYVGSQGGPRPGFALPPGRFINPGTGLRVPYGPSEGSSYSGSSPTVDRFFPGGGGRSAVQSRGIQGRHFIEPAFAVFAHDFPIALKTLYDLWIADASAKTTSSPVTTTA